MARYDDEVGGPLFGRLDNRLSSGASLDKFECRGWEPQPLTEPGKQCLALALDLSDQLLRRNSRINEIC